MSKAQHTTPERNNPCSAPGTAQILLPVPTRQPEAFRVSARGRPSWTAEGNRDHHQHEPEELMQLRAGLVRVSGDTSWAAWEARPLRPLAARVCRPPPGTRRGPPGPPCSQLSWASCGTPGLMKKIAFLQRVCTGRDLVSL